MTPKSARCLAVSVLIVAASPVWAARGPVQLTFGDGKSESYHAPVFSPDGKTIAYTRRAEGEPYHVWLMDADGRNRRELTHGQGDFAASWSVDSKRIAYQSPAKDATKQVGFSIWVVNADGSDARQLTTPPAGRSDQYPWWIDSRTVGYKQYNQEGQPPLKLAVPSDSGEPRPANEGLFERRSPDGSFIAFSSPTAVAVSTEPASPFPHQFELWVSSADGSGARKIVDNVGTWMWSLKSRCIYYSRDEKIHRVQVTGKKPKDTIVHDCPNVGCRFDVSPDDRWLLYSDSSEHWEGNLFKDKLPR
ncbi:MAG: PD40 domain-containing protein [Elusimicrobia bacterium]|nr:PD40 domain-containing protein [Elusimicrobiota bacterium]